MMRHEGTVIWFAIALLAGQPSPRDRVRAALDSMGGEATVRSIAGHRVEGAGYATGDGDPPDLTTFTFVETWDGPRLTQDVSIITAPGTLKHSVNQGSQNDWLTEAPDKVLLAALDAPDLVAEGDTTVRFTWQGHAVRVHFAGKLPAAVEMNGTTTVYSRWKTRESGIPYPSQWDMIKSGKIVEAYTASRVTILARGRS
jgi:hypothetical protein